MRATMRIEDEVEREGLRRLHAAQSAAVERFGDARGMVEQLDGIGDRDAGDRRRSCKTGRDSASDQGIDDRLHKVNAPMSQKGLKCRANHGFAGNRSILLRDFAPGALAASCRDNDRGHRTSHGLMLSFGEMA